MARDSFYALVLLGLLLAVISFKKFPVFLLELLLKLTRSGATVLMLGLIAFLFSNKLPYTAMAFALLSVYLLKDVWVNWVGADARRFNQDINADNARFNPFTSIDIQMADKTVVHARPSMVSPPRDNKNLVYPPSPETLREMNG
jgi:hypothetical protein